MFFSKMSVTALAGVLSIIGFGFLGPKNDVQPMENQVVMSAGELKDLFETMEKERAVVAELKSMFDEFKGSSDCLKSDVSEIYKQLESIQANKISKEEVESIVDNAVNRLKQELIEAQERSSSVISNAIEEKLTASRQEFEDQIYEVKASRSAYVATQSSDCDQKLAEHETRIKALEEAIAELKAAKLTMSQSPTPVAGVYGSVSSVKSSGGSNGGAVAYSPPPVVAYSCEPIVEYSQPSVAYAPVVSSYGGGCTGTYMQTPVYAPVQASDTKRVKIVEPREPRRVSFAEVPEADTSVAVQSFSQCADGSCGPVMATPRRGLFFRNR